MGFSKFKKKMKEKGEIKEKERSRFESSRGKLKSRRIRSSTDHRIGRGMRKATGVRGFEARTLPKVELESCEYSFGREKGGTKLTNNSLTLFTGVCSVDQVSCEDAFVEGGVVVFRAKNSSHSVRYNPLVDLRVGDLEVLEEFEELSMLSESRRETWVAVDEGDETAQVSLLATPKERIADVFWVFQGKEESVP